MLKRLLLLLVTLVAVTGCDHWIEKLEPGEIGFARHCFDLLRRQDFLAIEAMADASLRTSDLDAHLRDMAALIPAETPISSEATSVNVSTTNGYTTSTVEMMYRFRTRWLKLDIASEGSNGIRTLTWISLQQTTAPASVAFAPALAAIPVVVIIAILIGVIVYRRRVEKQNAARTTPEERDRRGSWSIAIAQIGARTFWLYRIAGIRRFVLASALSPEQCRQRLSRSIERESIFFRISEPQRNEFQGRVRDSEFRITRYRSVVFSDRYQTFLYGRLEADAAGTRIDCWLGPQRLVLGSVVVFLLFIWVIFPATMIGQQGFPFQFPFHLTFLLGPVVMTAFMVAMLGFSRKRLLIDGPYLLDFVAQTLEATATTTTRSPSVQRLSRE
jgi:hypothetical protein